LNKINFDKQKISFFFGDKIWRNMMEAKFGGAVFDIEITVLLIPVLFVRGAKKDRSRKTCESVSRCIGRKLARLHSTILYCEEIKVN